jgi:sugar O-acyltransferase (sialic acid O-acetyltransferase NeuD family)
MPAPTAVLAHEGQTTVQTAARTEQIIILGTGGSCVDILDIVHAINRAARTPRYECVGFLDDNPGSWDCDVQGLRVLGPLEAASRFPEARFVNGIGSQFNFWNKPAIVARTGLPPDRFETLVHPTASVSPSSSIGAGTVLFPNVTVSSNARVGSHVIILAGSVVNHDDVVGDYTCVTSGVCISGGVRIGQSCYLGANSSIINGIEIGDHCLVGIGSVVLDDVQANSVVVGNPARFLRHTRDEP